MELVPAGCLIEASPRVPIIKRCVMAVATVEERNKACLDACAECQEACEACNYQCCAGRPEMAARAAVSGLRGDLRCA
jgi:hypothetical protein